MSIATLKQLSAQATAGPWSKNIDDERVGAPEIYLNNGYIVAECHGPEKKRNGQLIAAMRNNIDALIAVAEAAQEVADDLESHLKAQYANTQEYPTMSRRFERDMQCVRNLRAALARLEA